MTIKTVAAALALSPCSNSEVSPLLCLCGTSGSWSSLSPSLFLGTIPCFRLLMSDQCLAVLALSHHSHSWADSDHCALLKCLLCVCCSSSPGDRPVSTEVHSPDQAEPGPAPGPGPVRRIWVVAHHTRGHPDITPTARNHPDRPVCDETRGPGDAGYGLTVSADLWQHRLYTAWPRPGLTHWAHNNGLHNSLQSLETLTHSHRAQSPPGGRGLRHTVKMGPTWAGRGRGGGRHGTSVIKFYDPFTSIPVASCTVLQCQYFLLSVLFTARRPWEIYWWHF